MKLFIIQLLAVIALILTACVIAFAQNSSTHTTDLDDIKTVIQLIGPAILCWVTFKVELASLKSTVKEHHDNKFIHTNTGQVNDLKNEMISSKECKIIQSGCSNEINTRLTDMKEDVNDVKATLRIILDKLNKPI